MGKSLMLGLVSTFQLKKIAEMLIKISGKKVKINKQRIRFRPKKSEVNFLLADNKKIKKIIRWKPKYNNYKKIHLALINTYKWFKNNRDKYNFEKDFVE